MKLLEYLLIYNKPVHAEACGQFLGLQPLEMQPVSARYLQVHPRLVLWFYELNGLRPGTEPLVEHLKGHLSGILVLADQSLVDQPDPAMEMVNELAVQLPDIPYLVGVQVDAEKYRRLHPVVHRSGLFLSEQGRLFFWTPQTQSSIARLWQALLLGVESHPDHASSRD